MPTFHTFSLKPFSIDRTSFTDEEIAYFDFYGINFSEAICESNHIATSHNFGYYILDSFSIATHYFSSPNFSKTIVINHGYMDHSGLYKHLIKVLLEHKFNVLIYDLPGHGLSSGEQAGIQSYQNFQTVLSELLGKMQNVMPKPWFIIGQSMGGAISSDFVLHDTRHTFEKCVFIGPFSHP